MKHLKAYTTISRIEELSDYLQEFFDTFNILETSDDTFEPYMEEQLPAWFMEERCNCIHVYIKSDEAEPILHKLQSMKEVLEKRMGRKIYISSYRHPPYTRIQISINKNR